MTHTTREPMSPTLVVAMALLLVATLLAVVIVAPACVAVLVGGIPEEPRPSSWGIIPGA